MRSTMRRMGWLGIFAVFALQTGLMARADRDQMTPTGWLWYTSASEDFINEKRGEGWRLISIDVVDNNPMRFAVVFVHNSGSYYNPVHGWYFNQTTTNIETLLAGGQYRLLQCKPYLDAQGQLRYATLFVGNTGPYFKGWWYHPNTTLAGIDTIRDTYNMRLISWERVPNQNGHYSCVFISNTGTDQRNWWRYPGVSSAQISTLLDQHNARITDISYGGGNYDVVLEEVENRTWWYWRHLTGSQLSIVTGNRGARMYDLQKTGDGPDGPLYTALLLNNSNALTTRVSSIMRGIMDTEIYVPVGASLKRVNGGYRAWLHGDRVFDPASTIKTLHHVHAMRQVALGNVSFTANVWVRGWNGDPGGCPPETPSRFEDLDDVLRLMMENSDNVRTEAIKDYFGQDNINATADDLQMFDTELVRRIGCGGPHNALTLEDAGRLHEAVVNGYLGGWRDEFYDLMSNGVSGYGGGAGYPDLGDIVAEEAADIGLPDDKRDDFLAAIEVASKGGSVGLDGLRYRSVFTWISIPYKSNGQLAPQEFVTGTFVDGAEDDDNAGAAVGAAASEILRDEIHNALLTWFTPATLQLTPATDFDLSGLPGGPFTPNSKSYTLTNVGDATAQWNASVNKNWIKVLPASGALPAGGSSFVTIYTNDPINALSPGAYNAVLTVTNQTNGQGNTTRDVHLTVLAYSPGDLNCDGAVDFFDIDAFMLALLDPSAYARQYRGCDSLLGDVNHDGVLDFFDIDPFTECVLNSGCP